MRHARAGLLLGAGVLLAANVTAWAAFTPAQAAASPARCITPAGTWLLSGQAGDFPVTGHPGVQTFVCTDGTWVHVTGYGNTPGQAGPA